MLLTLIKSASYKFLQIPYLNIYLQQSEGICVQVQFVLGTPPLSRRPPDSPPGMCCNKNWALTPTGSPLRRSGENFLNFYCLQTYLSLFFILLLSYFPIFLL